MGVAIAVTAAAAAGELGLSYKDQLPRVFTPTYMSVHIIYSSI